VPIQRLLIETDATYRNDFTTLHNCYTAIAEMREMSLEKLSESVAENFNSYFLTHYC
jgi:Tat protein secretion system quality control protein TatD with DNase activity